MNDKLGKAAEAKITEWLDKPEEGYSFDRIYDQMTGFWGSSNICDFICFKSPYMYYIESKATWEDRFDFSMLSQKQHDDLRDKTKIPYVRGLVIVLYATYKRAFIFDIRDIIYIEEELHKKSINIKKLDSYNIPYAEIETIPNNRKQLLDYTGSLETYCSKLRATNTF